MSLIGSDDLPAGKTAEEEGANSLGPVLVHPGAEGLMEPPGAGVGAPGRTLYLHDNNLIRYNIPGNKIIISKSKPSYFKTNNKHKGGEGGGRE